MCNGEPLLDTSMHVRRSPYRSVTSNTIKQVTRDHIYTAECSLEQNNFQSNHQNSVDFPGTKQSGKISEALPHRNSGLILDLTNVHNIHTANYGMSLPRNNIQHDDSSRTVLENPNQYTEEVTNLGFYSLAATEKQPIWSSNSDHLRHEKQSIYDDVHRFSLDSTQLDSGSPCDIQSNGDGYIMPYPLMSEEHPMYAGTKHIEYEPNRSRNLSSTSENSSRLKCNENTPRDSSTHSFSRREIENDTSLPIANIGRLMKSVLPGSAKIAKQAKDMVRECVAEFIQFIASEASDRCTMERRKTLSADDIFLAMSTLGFEHYNEALRTYHMKWREMRDHASMAPHSHEVNKVASEGAKSAPDFRSHTSFDEDIAHTGQLGGMLPHTEDHIPFNDN